jgi:hypothetical protein
LGTSDGVGAQLPAQDRPAEPGWRPDGDLSPLEEEMVARAAVGELVDRGEGPFTLAEMQTWGEGRTVRAAVLRHLLVEGPSLPWPVHAKGVRLRGTRISGHLDLEAATLRCPLSLECCYLDADDPARLDYATASRVTLTGCELAGLTGKMLTTRELDLSRSTLTGPLVLLEADIAGQLSCSGAQLTGTDSDGNALAADRMKVGDAVFLDGGFTAAGALRLLGADVTGPLRCHGAQLTGTDSRGLYALYADGLKVGGGVFLDSEVTAAGTVRPFTAAGTVRLFRANIGGLRCSGAHLTGTKSKPSALYADGLKVGGDVFLDGGFTAGGAVQLAGAGIAGQLSCSGAQLTGTDSDGYALFAQRIKVAGDVSLDEGFTAGGAVQLAGADITGQLSCSGAQLTGTDSDGDALFAEQMKAGRGVLLDGGFTAAGAVRLGGADITVQLSCSGAQLTGSDSDGDALAAEGIKVGGNVFLDDGFTTRHGAVSLMGADITGQLVCRGVRLAGRGDGNALLAEDIKVGRRVFLDKGFTAAGAVRLGGADISGELSCSGAQLTGSDSDGYALAAEGIKVGGDVSLDEGFTVAGAVHLVGADISGELSCSGAHLTGSDSDGDALFAQGIKVGSDVFFDDGFATRHGAVNLAGADISGELSCSGAHLTGTDSDGDALFAQGIKVRSGVFLDKGFTAAGAVNLAGADITGQLSCRGAQLTGSDSDGNALIAEGIKVGGNAFLDGGFTTAGTVSLESAQVGGSVWLAPTTLAGEDEIAFNFIVAQAQIVGTLWWAPVKQVSGWVNLEGTSVGELKDNWSDGRVNGHWPAGGRLRLDGFSAEPRHDRRQPGARRGGAQDQGRVASSVLEYTAAWRPDHWAQPAARMAQ